MMSFLQLNLAALLHALRSFKYIFSARFVDCCSLSGVAEEACEKIQQLQLGQAALQVTVANIMAAHVRH